jgi:hypothetical protein
MITQSQLRDLLYYHPESGDFVWLATQGNRVNGRQAGHLCKMGYIHIRIDGYLYKAHRLAWLYTHGKFPPDEIDHTNCVKADNRIKNLRAATHAENMRNTKKYSTNTSGYKGVEWIKRRNRWRAMIRIGDGKTKFLGYFFNIDDAVEAYRDAAAKFHGKFARIT